MMHARRRCSDVTLIIQFSLSLLLLVIYERLVLCEDTLILKITPPSDYLEEMKPASLVCTMTMSALSESGDFPLSWTQTGGLPNSSAIVNSQQTDVKGSVSFQSTLTFTPTALDNQVAIFCYARMGVLTGSTIYVPNIILVPVDPIITGPVRNDVSGIYTWTCRSDGASRIAPNVYWRNGLGMALTTGVTIKTNIEVYPNQNVVYSITISISLSWPTVVAGDSLMCIVVHQMGQYSSRKSATKAVVPPQVTKIGGDIVYINENSCLSMSCIVTVSSPSVMNVSWTNDGEPVIFSPGRYEPINTTSPNLTIVSVQRSDRGDYICTATSPVGTASFITPTTLVVKYPPTIHNLANQTTVEGSPGSTVTIPCLVDSFPYPRRILWNRILNDQVHALNISSSSRYSGGTIENQQYSLTISSLQAGDAGVYFCGAINDIGASLGPNMTVVKSPGLLTQDFQLGSTTAIVFAVISLILLLILLLLVTVFCLHGKCTKRHERAKVSPFMIPSARHYRGGLFVPPLNHKASSSLSDNDEAAIFPAPRIVLPPIKNIDIFKSSSMSEISASGSHHFSPLEPDTKLPEATLRWLARQQPSSVASYDQVWKVCSSPVIPSVDRPNTGIGALRCIVNICLFCVLMKTT